MWLVKGTTLQPLNSCQRRNQVEGMCYKQDSYISSTLDLVLKFKQKKQPNNFSYSPPSHQSQLGFSPCFSLTSTAGKKVHNIVLKYIINATLPRKTEVAVCNLNNKAQ